MATALVTFAIPCRDAGPHLRPLLQSLLQQSRTDYELLLVDDASTDGSPQLARAVAGERLRVVHNDRPLGLAGNFARCVEHTTTPFLCIAHQDDVYDQDYLATLVPLLQADRAAAIAHCPARAIDNRGRAIRSAAEARKQRVVAAAAKTDRAGRYRLLFRGNFICCPSVLYRTATLRAVGGFDQRLQFALDWDLWFRLLAKGHDLATAPRPLLQYRRHERAASHSQTRSLGRFAEELQVVAAALRLGTAAGLLPANTRSPAVRNNVLHEALEDLRRGDRAAAAAKIAFVRAQQPDLAADPWLRTFLALAGLGAPGRAVLLASRALAVRLGNG